MATRKPTTAKKTKTTKAAKVTAVKTQRLGFLTLKNIWLVAVVLFLGLAAAAVLLMDRTSFVLTQTHLATDALLSVDSTVFVPAARPVWDAELRWLVAALMVLSAVAPVLYLTRLKTWYSGRLATRRVLEVRWLDLAVTSTLMIEIIALLVGYTDVATLKLMGGMMILTCALSWLAEGQNEKARKPIWTAFGLSVFAGMLPWLMIGSAKAATLLFGEVRSPWYVYAACLTALAGFVLLAVNQRNQHRRFGEWADYTIAERNYALISVTTKLAFAGILIAGLLK